MSTVQILYILIQASGRPHCLTLRNFVFILMILSSVVKKDPRNTIKQF